MDELKAYIVSGEASLMPTARQLDRLVERYPWFATARVLRSRASGVADPVAVIALTGKPLPRVYLREVAPRRHDPTVEIIDSFLSRVNCPPPENSSEKSGAAGEIVPDYPVLASAAGGEDRDEVSEELAEIYLAQGLDDLAADAYRKLSLLYPKKSVYFAAIIERIDKQKQ